MPSGQEGITNISGRSKSLFLALENPSNPWCKEVGERKRERDEGSSKKGVSVRTRGKKFWRKSFEESLF